MTHLKITILSVTGVIGAGLSWIFGGFDAALQALCILMAIDIITGFTNALVFKKSKKTINGLASSAAGIKGITRKFLILMIVVAAHQADIIMNTGFIRDGVVISYATMELVSILENAGFMGLPIPKILKNALEILNKKEDSIVTKLEEEIKEEE
jgi:toxin secretion/phage lysis holin